jgi:hypothetical protein
MFQMFTFKKILPAIALAIALSPFAAQAHTTQPAQGGNQTLVQSGSVNQMYPVSTGG